jgi:hypothetical protein
MAERDLVLLQELAEIGMDLARALRRQALAQMALQDIGDRAGVTEICGGEITLKIEGDPGLTFSRIARSVRQTLALKGRINEQRLARIAGIALETQAREAKAAKDQTETDRWARSRRRRLAEGAVLELIEQRAEDEREDLTEALGETLDAYDEAEALEDLDYQDWDDQPVSQIIARICQDLGLTPDWPRWARRKWAAEAAEEAGPPHVTREAPRSEPPVRPPSNPMKTLHETGPP